MHATSRSLQYLLAFDVGNSSVKCAARVNGSWGDLVRSPTAPTDTLADRLAGGLTDVLPAAAADARCLASSVHPAADRPLTQACERLGLRAPEFFGRDLTIPLPARVKEPETVGCDRLLLALGARAEVGAPCAVVSAGTAITIDLVETDGTFAGGAIAPGFRLGAKALHEGTALLPFVEAEAAVAPPGKTTRDAVLAGVYWSCMGAVRCVLERYRRDLERPDLPAALTGTDAPRLREEMTGPCRHLPRLIYRGMAVALDRPR
ncbi:MAG: type III pantothenate kinase [Planctomycetota bacterium]